MEISARPTRREVASLLPLLLALAVGGCSGAGSARSHRAAPTSTTSRDSGATPAVAPGPTVPVEPVTPPTGRVVTVPARIADDCSSDVTAALNAWIASVPDNSTVDLGMSRCYRIDGTVALAERARLVLDGRGSTLRAGPEPRVDPLTASHAVRQALRTRGAVRIVGGNDLTVRNLTVRGPTTAPSGTMPAYDKTLEAQHAFEIDGAVRVHLERVRAFDVRGDFVYVGGRRVARQPEVPSRAVAVLDSQFERAGRQGIAIVAAHDVLVQGNSIRDVARSMFDVEPNVASEAVRDVRIVANTTGRARNFWLADKSPAAMDIGDITIVGNVMTEPTGGLVFVYGRGPGARGPFRIERNRFLVGDTVHDEGSTGAFFFVHTNDVSITGNTAVFPPGGAMPAVELRSCENVRVDGNIFRGYGKLLAADGASRGIAVHA